MKHLFSSIAWNREQSSEVANLLRAAGSTGIEGAPNLFERPLAQLEAEHIRKVRTFWEREGLPIRAMQALLFGKPELRLFGSDDERKALADYLHLVFRVAGNFGGGPLVFGSPRNRVRGQLPMDIAFDVAAGFFRKLAPYAAEHDCTLCIEANAPAYGCDFITTHGEAAALVAAVNTKGFGLQVDTGVMQMNGETPADIATILRNTGLVPSHVHASQPHLAPFDGTSAIHLAMAAMLRDRCYTGFVSVEMKMPNAFEHVVTAAHEVHKIYGARS